MHQPIYNSVERKIFNDYSDRLVKKVLELKQSEEVIEALSNCKVISAAERRRVVAIANCNIKIREAMKICNTTLKRGVRPPLRLLQILRALKQFPQLNCVTLEIISMLDSVVSHVHCI